MKLGLQGLRSLWLIALPFLSIVCYVNEDPIPAVASWPLIAREMPCLTKLIFPLMEDHHKFYDQGVYILPI